MTTLIGAIVAIVISLATSAWGLTLLVHVDRSTYEPVVGLWSTELTTRGRRALSVVAYFLLVSGLLGTVRTFYELAAWL